MTIDVHIDVTVGDVILIGVLLYARYLQNGGRLTAGSAAVVFLAWFMVEFLYGLWMWYRTPEGSPEERVLGSD